MVQTAGLLGKRIIVVVDADASQRAFVEAELCDDYTVLLAGSGEEALELVTQSEDIPVVVSELALPGMGGLEFLTRLKVLRSDTIRLVLAGSTTMDKAVTAVNTGQIFRYLIKPVEGRVLRDAVQAAIAQHDLLAAREEVRVLRRVHAAMEGVISGFGALVESRDAYTSGHQKNVARLAVAIAREMGLHYEDVEGLRLGALIHDIGKLYVPAGLLNKPAALTAEELDHVRTHPQVGYDILSPIDFPWPIAQMVYQHHERMDGTGYPQGLSGDDILPEARIIAVADVVEAISADRPYRPARELGSAMDEIRAGSGSVYDKAVCDACIRVLECGDFELRPLDGLAEGEADDSLGDSAPEEAAGPKKSGEKSA